jgi:intracellular septation protein A
MNKTKTGIIITLLINIVMPFVAYRLLIPHTSSLTALSVAAAIPLCDTLFSLIKSKKVDAFSSFIFVGLLMGVIAVLIGGDEKFILLRESYVTGIMGCLFLASLFFSKPLIYHFSMRFTGNNPAIADKWGRLPEFRNTFRLMTLVWGISLLLEACFKVLLVYTFSVSMFLAISPILSYGIMGLTILWNVKYSKQIKERFYNQ